MFLMSFVPEGCSELQNNDGETQVSTDEGKQLPLLDDLQTHL